MGSPIVRHFGRTTAVMPSGERLSMRSVATFDETGQYRYWLVRSWDSTRPAVNFIMLNPSRANHEHLDPTITRCLRYALMWGFGRLIVTNLFAWRSPRPDHLIQAADPIGPQNDHFLMQGVRRARVRVAAWGIHGSFRGRDAEVLALLHRFSLMSLGVTQKGDPRHPLYMSRNAVLSVYDRRRFKPS